MLPGFQNYLAVLLVQHTNVPSTADAAWSPELPSCIVSTTYLLQLMLPGLQNYLAV
jgi:hypothetical protein